MTLQDYNNIEYTKITHCGPTSSKHLSSELQVKVACRVRNGLYNNRKSIVPCEIPDI